MAQRVSQVMTKMKLSNWTYAGHTQTMAFM